MKRKVLPVISIIIGSITIFSFQNCAPPQLACDSATDSSCSENLSSSSSGNNQTGSTIKPPSSGGASSTGGSSSGGGTFGPGGTAGSGSSGTSGGGGSSGSIGPINGGNSSGGTQIDTSNPTFRFVKDVSSTTVNEGEEYAFSAQVYGGTSPYKYQWYHNDQPIQNGMGISYFYTDRADRWSKEGRYHVVVTDAKGAKLTSLKAGLSIREVAGGCETGTYYLLKKVDSMNAILNELFHNSRGKWAYSTKYDEVGTWASYGVIRDQYLQGINNNQALVYLGTMNVSCRSQVAYIHSPQPNPGSPYSSRYEDGYGYTYSGALVFECRNNRFVFKQNTCQWLRTGSQ